MIPPSSFNRLSSSSITMGASRVPLMEGISFFSVAASEGWSPSANEIFLDVDFLHGDKENVESRRWVCVLVRYKRDFVAWDAKPLLFRLSKELMFVHCEFGVTDEWVRGIVIL